MKRNLRVILLIGFMFQLVGCATNSKPQVPVPVVEKTQPAVKPEIKQPEKPVEPVVPAQPAPQTQAPLPAASNNAVSSLVTQARAQYLAKNYQGAIATAERALRIDRRAPDVYLVLAQSYIQLANTQLALQFVQQGIRYSQAGTELAQTLLQMRDSLAK